ncbi:macro domain-containing protein [Kutzneria sp. CA-103260]|uniref:macro domain-containing protein n=1 Tax=Kutzneria sp. CA-103260 TaxID=2802641 RepID=UPI001BA561BA|nr:macro domain-containing protein [Kutzneria sp. CA-103260]QUQ63491.1 O-acetyl-ADP-ribose deacetylase [Kutzneria sp. CA-103260]
MDTLHALLLSAYREAIALDEPFRPTGAAAPPDRLVQDAARLLGGQTGETLRDVLPRRAPGPMEPEVAAAVDVLLAAGNSRRAWTDPLTLPTIASVRLDTTYPAADHTSVWRGDITTLAADAIVNAANSALLGCFLPRHHCVDNAIHSAAGPRLREDCNTIMAAQGAPEPTGTAKITRGYHLPARYVLHTVGPIVTGPVHLADRRALADSYRACLDLAAEVDQIRTIAFCGVSTGVFGFPKTPAAGIALSTVEGWLSRHPGRFDRVVFTTFGADDLAAYLEQLTTWT